MKTSTPLTVLLTLLTLTALAPRAEARTRARVVSAPRIEFVREVVHAAGDLRVSKYRLPTTSSARRGYYQLALLSEGYAAGEENLFLADARAMADRLVTDSAGESIRSRWTLDFFFVFIAAPEAVSLTGPARTNFGTHLSTDMLEFSDAGYKALDAAYAATVGNVGLEVKGVVCRLQGADQNPDTVRAWARFPWGALGGSGFMCLPAGAADAFVHELGHALFGLGDEYRDDHAGPPSTAEARGSERLPNLTADRTSTRFRVHTSAPLIEGGAGFAKGVFHAFEYCRMNQSRSQKFCAVCDHAIGAVRYAEEQVKKPYRYATRNGIGLLHEATAATKATGSSVLLQDHLVDGLPYGDVHARPGEAITLRWALLGVMPKTWTITIEGHGVSVSKTVSGAAHQVQFNGLPGLVDPPAPMTKKRYTVWLSSVEYTDVPRWGSATPTDRIPIGFVRVPAN